jgi:hypothetical protein
MGGRPADRIAGIGAKTHRPKIGRDRRRRATAGTGGHAVERVWIAGVAGQDRADRFERAPRELRHVRFGQHQCPRLAQLADLESVAGGQRSLQRQRPRRGRHVRRIEIVFDDQRHAMQWAGKTGLSEFSVERIGGRQGVRVDHDDRIERRAFLVVGCDAVEVHLDELPASQLPRFERGADVGDRRFLCAHQGKRTSLARRCRHES